MSKHFEIELEKRNLSKSVIEKQSLEELEKSLAEIDNALRDKKSFGTVRLNRTSDGRFVEDEAKGIVADAGTALLARKAFIIQRIKKLQSEKIGTLKIVEKYVADSSEKTKLLGEIDESEKKIQILSQTAHDIDSAQKQAAVKTGEQIKAEWQIQVFKERAAIWKELLQRESIASVVGALLLVLIGLALLIAMFAGVPTTNIIENSFLVLLGYFFGQTISRKTETRRDDSHTL